MSEPKTCGTCEYIGRCGHITHSFQYSCWIKQRHVAEREFIALFESILTTHVLSTELRDEYRAKLKEIIK